MAIDKCTSITKCNTFWHIVLMFIISAKMSVFYQFVEEVPIIKLNVFVLQHHFYSSVFLTCANGVECVQCK